MEKLELTFSAPIFAADQVTRQIAGTIVPFGQVGNTSAGAVSFEFGAFGDINPEDIKLNLEHDRTRPIGRGVPGSLQASPNGLSMAFKIANTQAGTDALIEAADGLRDSFSIEATADQYTIEKGVMKITAATLTGVAHVTAPAFSAAKIMEVAASEEPEATEAEEAATEEVEENATMEEENTAPAAEEVTASAVVQASAPIHTQPRSPIVNAATYMEHSVKAALGSDESRQYVRAADDSTANNTGLTLAPHMSEFVSTSIGGRATIDAVSSGVLPASGMSFTIPKLNAAPTVGVVDEEDPTAGTGMTSNYLTIDVQKFAGSNVISWELLDRSDPLFFNELVREMGIAYAKATDEAVLDAIIALGTAGFARAATADGLQAFVATEAAQAYKGSGNFARNLVVSPDVWSSIMYMQDGADRPLYVAANPQNNPGSVAPTSLRGNVLGLDLYVDAHVAASGFVDNSAFIIAPEAVTWYESAKRQVQVQVIGTGQVEVAVYGYGAVAVKKPAGVRKFVLD